MKYTKTNNPYGIHLIKTKKFKTLYLRIVFTKKITKEEITIRNLLLDNLLFSCNKYDTKKAMNIKKQDLYGADIYASNKRVGNYFVTEITLSLLNPKYTEKNMFNETIDFLHEILFNPNVTDNHFNEEFFNITKHNMIQDIESIKENPSAYSMSKLKKSLGDYPFSYQMNGYLEDLDKITSSDLYNYYLNFLINNNIDIFLVGDYPPNAYDLIMTKLKFNTQNKIIDKFLIEYKNKKREIKYFEENSTFNQSKLSIGCSLDKLTKKEIKHTTTIYNIILGNSPDSKFFKNIREKKSYAYTISSGFRRMDNILTISCGISYSNYENVLSSIKEEINEMKLGNFSDLDIENAKNLYKSAINDIYEYAPSICDYYYNLKYLKANKINNELKKINAITKEEIIKVANKIKIDTVFLLKEESNGEN